MGTYPVANTLKNAPAPSNVKFHSRVSRPSGVVICFGLKMLSGARNDLDLGLGDWEDDLRVVLEESDMGLELDSVVDEDSGAMYGRKIDAKMVQNTSRQKATWNGANRPKYDPTIPPTTPHSRRSAYSALERPNAKS